MDFTIFYSWQSDLPNSTNKTFIEKSLQKAIDMIRKDDRLQIEPVIDRDTFGIPGSPDIADTIFKKIDKSFLFVADVSIINFSSDRKSPNPNVLIELGYALKALGQSRIIMTFNSFYGKVEELPFDLKMKRTLNYCCDPNDPNKSVVRKELVSKFHENIVTVVESVNFTVDDLTIGTEPEELDEIDIKAILSSFIDENYSYSTGKSLLRFSDVDNILGFNQGFSKIWLKEVLEEKGFKVTSEGKSTISFYYDLPF